MHHETDTEPAGTGRAVSGHAALLRAATGFGVGTALVTTAALLWHDILDMALLPLLLTPLQWLHEPDDAHRTTATVTAGIVSLLVGAGAAAIGNQPDAAFSRDVAFAALGALAGSQAYAAVTRRHRR